MFPIFVTKYLRCHALSKFWSSLQNRKNWIEDIPRTALPSIQEFCLLMSLNQSLPGVQTIMQVAFSSRFILITLNTPYIIPYPKMLELEHYGACDTLHLPPSAPHGSPAPQGSRPSCTFGHSQQNTQVAILTKDSQNHVGVLRHMSETMGDEHNSCLPAMLTQSREQVVFAFGIKSRTWLVGSYESNLSSFQAQKKLSIWRRGRSFLYHQMTVNDVRC